MSIFNWRKNKSVEKQPSSNNVQPNNFVANTPSKYAMLQEIKELLEKKTTVKSATIINDHIIAECQNNYLWTINIIWDATLSIIKLDTILFQPAVSKFEEVFDLINDLNNKSLFLKLYRDWDGVHSDYDVPIIKNFKSMSFVANIFDTFLSSVETTFKNIPTEYLGGIIL